MPLKKEGKERPAGTWFMREEQLEYDLKQVELDVRRQELEAQVKRDALLARMLIILTWVFVSLLAATLAVFVLQGFQIGGFSLDREVLLLLGGATIGEVAGLLSICLTAITQMRKTPAQSTEAEELKTGKK
jgi:hypothetical protein